MAMQMRVGHLQRDTDPSGVSGCGSVGEVIRFSDGQVVVHWTTKTPSTGIYRTLKEMLKVHGHEGKTRVVWVT